MNRTHFEILCAKSVSGEISEREKEELERLLSRSEKLKKEFEELQNVWNLNESKEPRAVPDAETEWTALERRIENSEKSSAKSSPFENLVSVFKSLTVKKLRPALSFGFAALIIAAGIFFFQNGKTDAVKITVNTANKEIKEIALPDGSTAKLNSGSEIEFLKNFDGGTREIKLRGEAFFSVVKNGKPFVVLTENSRTTVLGTKFDVKFRGGVTKVIVKEGRVKLQPSKAENNGVILTKNLSAFVFKNQLSEKIDTVNADYLLGWLEGKLVFRRAPLAQVAKEMERFYDAPIQISSEELNGVTLTGTFKNRDVDSTLSMICLALNLEYHKEGNKYVIKSKENSAARE